MEYCKTLDKQRADQIAYKLFGDVKYTKDIINANPVFYTSCEVPADTVIKIPNIEIQKKKESKGINLWS